MRAGFFLFLAVTFPVAAQSDLTQKLDAAAQSYAANRQFMGTVLVAQHGKILLEKGYGKADLEWDIPNTPDARFRLGSITKQFTATAILELAEQGKLSVADAACKYFDGCPESWKRITIHQLLSHTSGIPSYTGMKEFGTPKMMRIPLTPREVLLLTADKPLDFEPGTKWSYDNSGYIFLGVIIEKVTGQEYADYIKTHIFDPLGMSNTGYDLTAVVLTHRASGYRPCQGDSFCNADYLDMSLPYAAGSLYSTTGDLYKWDRALCTDKVLSAASREKMWTPVMHDYAYGWMTGNIAKHKTLAHGGGINGFATFIARFPQDDAVVIALSNNEASNPHALTEALAGTLFGEKVELPQERKIVPIDAKLLDRYAGTYQVGPMKVTFKNEKGHLMASHPGQPTLEVKPLSETQFLISETDAVITFSAVDTAGKAQEVRLEQRGGSQSGKRVTQ